MYLMSNHLFYVVYTASDIKRLVSIFVFLIVVPHITDTIQEWVANEAKKSVTPDNLEPEVSHDG